MAGHTPGQWEFYKNDGTRNNRAGWIYQSVNYFTKSGTKIAFVYSEKAKMHVGEAVANGSLIAAAPDLLAACKAFMHIRGGPDAESHDGTEVSLCVDPLDTGLSGPITDVMKAAIAKAEGNQ
jgi:hypothetical protein